MGNYSKTVDYESGTDGDALTLVNTNSDVLRLSAGAGTSQISSVSHGGTRSMLMGGGSTGAVYCVEDTLPGDNSKWEDIFYIRIATLPSAEVIIARLMDASGTVVCKIGLNGVGALIMRDSTGTNLYSSPSGKRMTAGTDWYGIKWEVTGGASGSSRFRWWPPTGSLASPTDDSTTKAANNPAFFSAHRRGIKCEASNATGSIYFDDHTLTGTSALVASAGSPVSKIKAYKTASFTPSATGGAGSATFTWAQVAGTPAKAMSTDSAGILTVTAPPVMNQQVLTFEVTANDGVSTAKAQVQMAIDTHPMWVKRSDGLHAVRAVLP